MELFVDTNLLKLLTPSFVHISHTKNGMYEPGKSYHISIPKHGVIGTVRCHFAATSALYNINNFYVSQSEGQLGYTARMQALGHMQLDIFQVNQFRFIKRKTNFFQTLFEENRLVSDLNIIPQSSLFNQP